MLDNIQNILNKFTQNFKKVLINAQNLAVSKKHNFIEPEDLLAAVGNLKGSLGSDILLKQKIDPVWLQENQLPLDYHQNINNLDPRYLPQPSVASQQIIEKAVVTAYKFQHKYIGTEHLLWGLGSSTDEQAQRILTQAKINATSLKQHLNLVLKSTSKFNELLTEEETREIEELATETTMPENTLENFTINLTNPIIQKNIDPVIGRAVEINLLIEILSRRTKNNPVLLGDAGVGKTAIVEGLAKRILENNVPDVLLNKTILTLDLSGLLAGTMYRGEFESRLKQIINEVKNNPNIILFIDEVHMIMGAGATTGSLDAANILKPALSRGQLRCIGATTFEEYKKYIESDRALERRFQPIIIKESSAEETYQILQGLRNNYEKFHQVKISDEALRTAIALSQRFLPDKRLPDKALDLIDQAAARYRVQHANRGLTKKIKILEGQLASLEEQKKQAVLTEKYQAALEHKQQAAKIQEKLKAIRKKAEQETMQAAGEISSRNISAIISALTGVPVQTVKSKENKQLINLEKHLAQQIFGQNQTLEKVAQTLRKSKAGLQNKNRPLASFMFLGPSGVGKTETAKQLARLLFGGQENMLRLDMSEFSEKFNISKLIGSPAGYVGYKEGNKLTDIVKNRPSTLLLFDEIEKAHPDVFNLLLPILEEGELTDATGRTVNFRNCVIVMTSNVGLDKFNNQAALGFAIEETNAQTDTNKEVINSLTNYFPPEFLNRLDNILAFSALNRTAAKKIIIKELRELEQKLKEQDISLEWDNKIVNYLLVEKSVGREGARGLKRLVDQQISQPLAQEILGKNREKIIISLEKNQIIIK